jgi:3-isopropylmalate dehydrogenase
MCFLLLAAALPWRPRTSAFTCLLPAITTILGIVLLGKHDSAIQIVGGALALARVHGVESGRSHERRCACANVDTGGSSVSKMPLRDGGPAARIAVIPGDGIGKEVTPEAVRVLRAVCAPGKRNIEFIEFDWSADKYLREGISLPPGAVEMLRDEFDAILFGALGDPRVPSNQHAADILLGLRFKLDLYVNARPVELLHDRFTPLRDRTQRDIHCIVFRENTEGLYVGIGGFFKKGTADEIAVQEDVNSRKGVERIIRYAFDYAARNGLSRVCMSDKSNAMTFAHDLWQRVFKDVRQEYPQIEARHLYIDTLAMEIIRDPAQFDVIVTCNLFGDIISDLGAQLAGGLGLAPSGNIHPGRTSLFEPVHGSAPNIAGKGIANPLGSVLTSGMMLEYLGWKKESEVVKDAVKAALFNNYLTPDLGGSMSTNQVGAWLTNQVAAPRS